MLNPVLEIVSLFFKKEVLCFDFPSGIEGFLFLTEQYSLSTNDDGTVFDPLGVSLKIIDLTDDSTVIIGLTSML